jgi:glucokinase
VPNFGGASVGNLLDDPEIMVVVGDVGGTNIRLVLMGIKHQDREFKNIIKEHFYDSQKMTSFEDAVTMFLSVNNNNEVT